MNQDYPSLLSIVDRHKDTLQLMHNHVISKSQQTVKHVYDRKSRNIGLFIREEKEFIRKNKEQPVLFGQKQAAKKKMRFGVTLQYQDNQTLELQYEPRASIQMAEPRPRISVNFNTRTESSRQSGFKSSKVSFLGSGPVKAFKLQLFPPHNEPKFKKAQSSVDPTHSKCVRYRSPTLLHQIGPSIRRRVITQFDEGSSRDSTSQIQQKRLYQSPIAMIEMNRQKMQRFIRNLHKIAWMSHFLRGQGQDAQKTDEFKDHMRQFTFDIDSAIPQSDLNYMISRRYHLLNFHLEDHYQKRRKQLDQHQTSVKRQVLATGQDYSLLDSLSKRSILTMINKKITEDRPKTKKKTFSYQNTEEQPQNEVVFHLPYSQFISQRQTKTSIYRLVSMSSITCLRIAFSLYDKNHNGKVDEDDLLQAIGLSRKMPQLEPDILMIAGVMFAPLRGNLSRTKLRRGDRESQFVRSGGERLNVTNNGYELNSTISIKKEDMEDSDEEEQSERGPNSNNKFSLDKFYTFLKEKSQNAKPAKPSQEKTVNALTFPTFCRAFKGKRPVILFDLFQFLFSAQKQDFTSQIHTQQLAPKQIPKKNLIKTQNLPEETLEQKWNGRLLTTNKILKNLLITSQQL